MSPTPAHAGTCWPGNSTFRGSRVKHTMFLLLTGQGGSWSRCSQITQHVCRTQGCLTRYHHDGNGQAHMTAWISVEASGAMPAWYMRRPSSTALAACARAAGSVSRDAAGGGRLRIRGVQPCQGQHQAELKVMTVKALQVLYDLQVLQATLWSCQHSRSRGKDEQCSMQSCST